AWAQFYPQKATLIQVDRDGSHLGRRHPIDLGVVGDVIPTLEALLPLLEAREERSFLDECLEHRERSLRTLEKEEQAGKGELIHPQHLVSLLDQHASEDALFT
ncbi:ubiquinone-dependent pyruvate dehydrogenase, partial [Pseudomonas aeruginosa]